MSFGDAELHAAGIKRRLRDLPPAAPSPGWLVYFALGALVLLAPLLPFAPHASDSGAALRILCAFLFFLLGALSRRIGRLQSQAAEIADLVDAQARERYGEDYYAVRAAVSALIADLPGIADDASRAHVVQALQDLTGASHGDDPAAWRAWWLEAKAAFEVAPRAAEGSASRSVRRGDDKAGAAPAPKRGEG
jgi:hypothetical protein